MTATIEATQASIKLNTVHFFRPNLYTSNAEWTFTAPYAGP